MKYVDDSVGIYLRLMTLDDTNDIVDWRNKDSVRKNFIYQELFTMEGHLNWIHNMIDTGKAIQMMICSLENDEPVGSVYIRDIDLKHKKAEYGIFIGNELARGKGVGTAAAKLMLKYCFNEIRLNRVYLRALAENKQAIRSYEKAGFVQEGYLVQDVCINGKFHDIVWMAITADRGGIG